jgi:hypothetical protein
MVVAEVDRAALAGKISRKHERAVTRSFDAK